MSFVGGRDEWGGTPGRLERKARHGARVSRHRREVSDHRRHQHRRRLLAFCPPAIVGTVILVWQLSSPFPAYGLVGLGMILVLPLLTELAVPHV